jgi:ribosomal protein S18 acetylase RimI-like enzyme
MPDKKTPKTGSPLTGPPAVAIRTAPRDDINAKGLLGALLVREHHEFDAKRFIPPSPETPVRYGRFLGTQIGKPSVVTLVATLHTAVVGYTYAGLEDYDYMSLRGPAGILYDIVVDPAQRGHGIGRLLLDATLDVLTRLGAPRVLLSTAEQNESAQRLFARAGFRRTMIEMTREADGT